MRLIDRLSYNSRMKEAHPAEKIFFSAGALAFVLISDNPCVLVFLFFLLSMSITVLAGVGLKDYIKLLSVPSVFILLGVITLALDVNSPTAETIFSVRLAGMTLSVSTPGALSGGTLFLRTFASVSCFYFFILTTPVSDFEYILKKMGLPALFREMFMMTYRFIFVTVEMAERIVISQRSRAGYGSMRKGFNSAGLLASSVFVKSYFFGKASYNAMLSRGYEGELNVIDTSYRYSAINIIMIVIFHSCFIFLVIRFR